MSVIDIWGAVVPAWLGGVGGMAAAVVSTIALVKSLRTQGGVETLRSAANAEMSSVSVVTPVGAEPEVVDRPRPTTRSPVSWTAWQESKTHYRLRNDSTNTGARATLIGFADVTPDGDGAAVYHGHLPVVLEAGESVPFTISKSFVSPSVTAVGLTWKDASDETHTRTLYI